MGLTIRQLIKEQRRRVRSANPAERLAAVLLIPAELSRRLRLLSDSQVRRLLEHEVCSNMSLLAPEAPICEGSSTAASATAETESFQQDFSRRF